MNFTNETSYPEYEISKVINQVGSTSLLLFGGIGNIATVFVMRRTKGNNSSFQAILQTLALVDFLLLYLGGINVWLINFFDVDLRNLHTAICKVHLWLVYSLGTVSAWLVTMVTVQRTIAVRWPHRMRMMCTVRRTRIAIAAVVFTSCCIHLHWTLGMEVIEGYCFPLTVWYDNFTSGIWSWVDMGVSSILPFICLFICDVILVSTLHKVPSISSMNISAISHASATCQKRRRKTASQTTVTILALSCTFLVLTLPVCIFVIWEHYMWDQIIDDPRLSAKADLAFTVTVLLWYANSAINFLLYCITGTRFRREFYNWVCCRPRISFSGSLTTSNYKREHPA